MGFGASRAEARQLVRHNGITVNGKRVNIPSYEVRPGEVIEVAGKVKEQLRVKAAAEAAASRHIPEWLKWIRRAEGHVQGAACARRSAPDHQREPDHRAVLEVISFLGPKTCPNRDF
jgi:small subunit ribosomal protein S4